jgi:PAS domain S-box-containing protein
MASAACGVYAVLGGAVTLLGWALGLPPLTDWNRDGISMFPNTAVAAILCGSAVLVLARGAGRRGRPVVRAAACLVGVIGGLTLSQHLSGVNLGIDTLLFETSWGQRAAAAPMRMGPPASTSYLVLGIGLLLATGGARGRRVASGLAVLPVGIASLSLIGFWFGADRLFGVARFTGIAFQTSTMVCALGVGLLAALPEHGLVAVLRRDDAGGLLARRLLLPIIAIPVVLGKLRIIGEQAGLYDTAFGIAILVLTMVMMLVGLLWWTAVGVSRHARLALHAERAVRESETRLKSILEQLPVAVGVMDATGRWTLTNQSMEGLVPEGIASMTPEGAGRWRAWDEHGIPLGPEEWPGKRGLRGERVIPGMEMLYTGQDGRETWMRVSTAPLRNEAGEIVGVTSVVQDIDLPKRFSDRLQEELAKRTDEVHRAAQSLALAQRLAAVGTMASGLAHDINNITFPLGTRLDVMLRNPTLDERVKAELSVITALVDHLRHMSRNLSLFSRDPEQEGTEGVAELTSWCARVQGLLEASLSGTEDRGADSYVRLRFDVPAGLPPVNVAPHRLTQAVLNLVHNSRDAILTRRAQLGAKRDDGCITLEARAGVGAVLIRIIDDGCGMDEPTLRRAVEPFFTTKHRPTAAGAPGSGLGLALAHAICERIGGKLEIESELGKGTTVTMSLPAAGGATPALGPLPELKPERGASAKEFGSPARLSS